MMISRSIPPEDGWRLPIIPPDGIGIVTPSCTDRTKYPVPAKVGVGLRIGGEATLCFACGPEGGVYHSDDMANVRAVAEALPFTTGYDPADLTPAVMAAYDADMRASLMPAEMPAPDADAAELAQWSKLIDLRIEWNERDDNEH